MKNKKLTLIVGAGASKEFGLPVGAELKQKIASLLDIRFDWNQQQSGDYTIRSALEAAVRQPTGRCDINPTFMLLGEFAMQCHKQYQSIILSITIKVTKRLSYAESLQL